MEKTQASGLHEIQNIYKELPPLDYSREIYLVALLFRQELGLGAAWDFDLERARKDYARGVGDAINNTIDEAETMGNNPAEEIENILVYELSSETQRRWYTYTSHIKSAGKEDAFQELLPEAVAITCSLSEKAEQIRESWKTFLNDYGVNDVEFNPNIRAEFVRNKVVWDTAKEEVFLRVVLADDQHQAVA